MDLRQQDQKIDIADHIVDPRNFAHSKKHNIISTYNKWILVLQETSQFKPL